MRDVPFEVSVPVLRPCEPRRSGVTRSADSSHSIALAGALGRSARTAVFDACTAAELVHLSVDVTSLQFMDCAGYAALVEARRVLERRGGSLGIVNPAGGPLELLSLLGPSSSLGPDGLAESLLSGTPR
jgi:anti-anti-sigma factor